MKFNVWTMLVVSIVLIMLVVIAYIYIPFVRYILIPVTGGTKAPIHLTTSENEPETNNKQTNIDTQTKPSRIFANAQGVVRNIQHVPEQGGWINSLPLDLQELQKQNYVVLIDFWTYSCINCIRATPYTQELWKRYKNYGFIVIGVHSPEFDFEKDPQNILYAIEKADITYPVLTDAQYHVWKKFDNHFWPGKYLINPQGVIVYTNFGEGDYEEEEEAVVEELRKAGWNPPDHGPPTKHLEPSNKTVTPELYAGPGFMRKPFGNEEQPTKDQTTVYTVPSNKIQRDFIYLEGSWHATHDYVESTSDGRIILNYIANAPYIVFAPKDNTITVEVLLDNQPVPEEWYGPDLKKENDKTIMIIDQARCFFPLAHSTPYKQRTIEFIVPTGLRFYAFTFGTY